MKDYDATPGPGPCRRSSTSLPEVTELWAAGLVGGYWCPADDTESVESVFSSEDMAKAYGLYVGIATGKMSCSCAPGVTKPNSSCAILAGRSTLRASNVRTPVTIIQAFRDQRGGLNQSGRAALTAICSPHSGSVGLGVNPGFGTLPHSPLLWLMWWLSDNSPATQSVFFFFFFFNRVHAWPCDATCLLTLSLPCRCSRLQLWLYANTPWPTRWPTLRPMGRRRCALTTAAGTTAQVGVELVPHPTPLLRSATLQIMA